MSSVSVRMKTAPISSIHFATGSAIGPPHARRSARMNAAFVSGLGEQTFTIPSISW
jgi:hypothetical protein